MVLCQRNIIMKTKIDENKNKKYQEIARLVDSPNFLEETAKLKEQLNPPGKIVPYENFQKCVNRQLYYRHSKEEMEHIDWLVDQKEILKTQGKSSNAKEIAEIERDLAIYTDSTNMFYFRVRQIKDMFHLPEAYMTLIAKVVICGEVHGNDLNINFEGRNPREIKMHRDWYWLYHGNPKKGYRKIAKEYMVAPSTVRSAIERYTENLL